MNYAPIPSRRLINVGRSAVSVAALLFVLRTSAADTFIPPPELVVLGGMNNIRHHNDQPFGALQIRFPQEYYNLRPYVHAGVAGHGSHYAGAGILHAFTLPHTLQITIGTGPGLYRHKQNDPDLGYSVEFDSWIEFSAEIMKRRVGLSVAHLSNAHLGRRNPGTEAVGLNIHLKQW